MLPKRMHPGRTTAVVVVCLLVCCAAEVAPADDARQARAILRATGVRGGLVVHLGCGDGKLTAGLHANDSYLVHGLDADAANVEKARRHVRSLDLRGKVFIDRWTPPRLPYVDNLVNLVVAEDLRACDMKEVLRVLAPEGVAYVRRGGAWTGTVKPRPGKIDEWTHYLHDPGGNAVAHDALVGPPRHMQWLGAPLWSRHHHTLASISSVVSSAGRIFYILDEGPAYSMLVPGKWCVVARDAFNGMLLWKRPMSSWAWHRKGFRSGPVQLPRTLVAVGARVYVPLGMSQPVSALDAATGEIVTTYEQTAGAEELILSGGVLLVVTGSPAAEQAGVDPAWRGKARFPNRKTIVALRAEGGKELWRFSRDGANPVPLTLACEQQRVFFQLQADKAVVCLDRETGRELWTSSAAGPEKPKAPAEAAKGKKPKRRRRPRPARSVGWSVATLVVHDGVVLLADAGRLTALSAKDGRRLWSCPGKPGFRSPSDVFVTAGPDGKLVWTNPGFSQGRDLRTGEVRKTSGVLADLQTVGHHHRCYREKATDRYIMTGHRGIEFLDLVADNHSRNNWVRGVCQYGIMPCNGLIYAPSHACGCYMEAKLYGFWALASGSQARPAGTQRPRLETGPAYGKGENPQSDGWPTHRGDAARSGIAKCAVGAKLTRRWQADVGGRITQPVVAGGRLLVASVDTHTVHALDAASGRALWTYVAGGRVDSSPTIHDGLVLFGCADGWVYCLRLADGKLAWRFRAAPEDLKTVALDQVESVWPVHGNVLVHKGVAYFAAGRCSWLDGGIVLYGLDPATGKVVHQSRLRSRHPRAGEGKDAAAAKYARKFAQNATDYKTFKAPDRSDAFSMAEGATTDVMVSDGRSVFLRHVRFDPTLVRQERMDLHLFSTSSLLDGHENHRSHWVLGTGDFSRMPVAYSWITYRPRNFGSSLAVPYGLILTFDEKRVWGVRRAHLMKWGIRQSEPYMLFAEARPGPPAGEKHLPDFRKAAKAAGKNVPDFQWTAPLAMRPRAMIKAGELLFLGGTPTMDPNDPFAAHEGRAGGLLWVMSAADGSKAAEYKLDSPPIWDGLSAAAGRLYVATLNGKVLCLASRP